ncbi:hypothetical protein MKW98_031529 [Papaver atlanticum]|uniref:Uncharacterized protein n=1 Tax=Papaver atlanticum TaxID=357466 RepID=A0AAD4S588_9MAGN|nr:hypothetical protein MKW98_031529 [Papaver atlanticum]
MLDKIQIYGDNKKQYYMKFRLKYMLKAFKNKFTKSKEKYKNHKKLMEDNTGLGCDPVLCTVDASNEWWDEQVKLAMIYSDTVPTGNLRQTQDGDFSSTDGEDEIDMPDNEVHVPSYMPPLDGNTQVSSNGGVTADGMQENIGNQFLRRPHTPSGIRRRAHVSNDSGCVVGEMEENMDNQFHHRSRTPIGSGKRRRKTTRQNQKCLLLQNVVSLK